MKCGYVSLKSDRQVHYRTKGEGPPLLILHPSPQSSAAMTASLNAFSSLCACYALDTPGYGLSDPMAQAEPTIGDYADTLVEAAGALGFEMFFVYGAATGSQLAIEMAKRYPNRVRFVMLDSNGHISDEMCEQLVLSGYFADVTPRRDGGHLLTYWDMCRHLFFAFPWNSAREADRLGYDIPPPSVIHETCLRYLQAGEDYAKAYKVALYTERRDHFDGMTTPTVMTRWVSSPVLSIADELIASGLPDNVRVLEADHGVEARFSVQIEALGAVIAETPSLKADPISKNSLDSNGSKLRRAYLSSGESQLHVRINTINDQPPLVILHGAGRSGAQMESIARQLSDNRHVIVIDLPGHGSSPNLPDGEDITLEAMASPIVLALQERDVEEIDIIGEGLGAAVGAELSRTIKTRRFTVLDSVPYTKEERETAKAALPDLSPRDDGAHLVSAWGVARDQEFFYPLWDHRVQSTRKGDADLAPSRLHEITMDIVRLGVCWREVVLLEIRLDWSAILDGVRVESVSVCSRHKHPCIDRLDNGVLGAMQHMPVDDLRKLHQ